MAWSPDSDEAKALAEIMRKQEISRRVARVQIIKNHVALTNDLNEQEKREYVSQLIPKDTRGYWKRLWDAVRNRK